MAIATWNFNQETNTMDMIEIDGAAGGGQLLRSALSLSLCTGTGFTMQRIRAKRSKPGLMRQHLTAVNAAARIGNAYVEGAELGTTTLRFEPGVVVPGEYTFATGSAGSATLVLQTVLPPLSRCDMPSTLRLEGGTHNPLAPSADFIADTYLPALRRIGIEATLELERPGFFPAGGGILHARVSPAPELRYVEFDTRGELRSIEATALLSGLSSSIGERELRGLAAAFGLNQSALHLRQVRPSIGPGNALLLRVRHAQHAETFTGHGERGLSAEAVAAKLADEARTYLASTACVAEHLSDQLLLPMALAGGGAFTTQVISDHLRSNARLIEKFLPVEIDWAQQADGAWRVRFRPERGHRHAAPVVTTIACRPIGRHRQGDADVTCRIHGPILAAHERRLRAHPDLRRQPGLAGGLRRRARRGPALHDRGDGA
jgi:RNA 3'-terminal phosphate cyclase (ATP)